MSIESFVPDQVFETDIQRWKCSWKVRNLKKLLESETTSIYGPKFVVKGSHDELSLRLEMSHRKGKLHYQFFVFGNIGFRTECEMELNVSFACNGVVSEWFCETFDCNWIKVAARRNNPINSYNVEHHLKDLELDEVNCLEMRCDFKVFVELNTL